MQKVTLWLHEFLIHYFIFHCKRNGIQLSNTFLYLKQNVLSWPGDEFTVETCSQCNIMHTLYHYTVIPRLTSDRAKEFFG